MQPLAPPKTLATILLAALSFHSAYTFPHCSPLIALFLYALFPLTKIPSAKLTALAGLTLGFLLYAPQLSFFYSLFGPFAILLWLLLSLYPAISLLLARAARKTLPRPLALLAIPILWTGLEYFRSELYYLRFAWLTPGLAFSNAPILLNLGVYEITFALLSLIALLHLLPKKLSIPLALISFLLLCISANLPPAPSPPPPPNSPQLVGIQLEEATESELLHALNNALAQNPHADLFVLSEDATPTLPDSLLDWCRNNHRYLLLGSSDPAPESLPAAPEGDENAFYNTAFIINPQGQIDFKQAKSVPVQFFSDGLPAKSQHLWNSPWGKIGICICYDLSYTRITDTLIRQGARALIVPTMDMTAWGEHEHQLHARIAPTRAAEYHLPIFRLTSSGISQSLSPTAQLLASTPYPGQGQLLTATLPMTATPTLPPDRLLAPICSALTAAFILSPLLLRALRVLRGSTPTPNSQTATASSATTPPLSPHY